MSELQRIVNKGLNSCRHMQSQLIRPLISLNLFHSIKEIPQNFQSTSEAKKVNKDKRIVYHCPKSHMHLICYFLRLFYSPAGEKTFFAIFLSKSLHKLLHIERF